MDMGGNKKIRLVRIAFLMVACAVWCLVMFSCSSSETSAVRHAEEESEIAISDVMLEEEVDAETSDVLTNDSEADKSGVAEDSSPTAEDIRKTLNITEDYRESFVHGEKPAEHQKYIVLHDTEGDGDASSVVNWWDGNGKGVAAHFIVNRDGSIVQCVPMDKIAHHAGFGDTGHNQSFGVKDESRDDKVGTEPIGSWASDYGMNSYSIGIEMVHVGGSGEYPKEQLEALDGLIAYIDAYYGFESEITDHKAWRSGNSDTSPEFAGYLDSYKTKRTHE